jgi:hypothetical protein
VNAQSCGIKDLKSKTAAAVEILANEYYFKWDTNKLFQAYHQK